MDPPFSPSQLRFGERMQRPALSNREFRRRRQELYPHTRDDGFPNDDIREGYDFYKGREHEETFAREDYNHADRAARRAMERMRVDESEYYDRGTGGYTPDQHRDLLPRANTWENRARE